ncbi:ATP-binding cassette domain-containing protein [Flagellimonas pacifica]|uniref:ABC-type multidrug transport system, ATPase component n=1 Tax=Flagellimonas pacifica TaxID=1247520 RepID=A0A285MX12_9FLAO|nr:ATP-binding cassette domain-containing protein [Allomuricauda parva]SNZ01223.1 ABC-type multidrug transport system, ATPase component [Allomuricauda parva]
MAELKVENLSKSFGDNQVLDDIGIGCRTNEIVGVFGRNGTGKSTMLKCIYGTLKADSINLEIDGIKTNPAEVIPSCRIGYLPQESFLPKNIKVNKVIPMFFPDSGCQDNVFYAPGIHGIQNKSIKDLSLGELRYFELVLVSFLDHDFLFLDEPFSMIDPLYKDLIRDFLIDLKKEKGIILTDHYYRDVLAVADKKILIKDSKTFDIKNEDDLVSQGYLKS